jgi:SagB-type dehydrogenase family enzyme
MRSTQEIPADFATPSGLLLNDMYLLVHAVTGLPPGAYVYHPREQMLELLQENDYRHEAAMLALGQELAADASANVYFLCDLRLVLEHYGNRGYRIAQLEAGLLAGRMYLAAYAQGLGATGLTFFDDEVIETFAPHAAGKSVMFLLALGHSASRRSDSDITG